jgi:hypothetical protein
VPGQEDARSHDPVQPEVIGQQHYGGEYGTVGPVRLRTGDLTAQHSDLMPKRQDLRILGRISPYKQHEPAEHPDHEQVDKADKHER